MYPPKRPSQIPKEYRNAADQPDECHQTTWLIQRFITSGIGCDNAFGEGNFLYVCLAALVELHLSTAPLTAPYIKTHGSQFQVILEYGGV